jgi:hypothetical protein
MERQFYLDLAARSLRMPIGADLVLNEQAEPEAVRMDGWDDAALVPSGVVLFGNLPTKSFNEAMLS